MQLTIFFIYELTGRFFCLFLCLFLQVIGFFQIRIKLSTKEMYSFTCELHMFVFVFFFSHVNSNFHMWDFFIFIEKYVVRVFF